ncbi:histidine phosphatase family protein [Algoriphagus sp.]|uniref:SixA phosphatase family protein n=1 Tax=Algoriphagus sp. TaxID=1872435 RepID=UPI00260EFFB9|nr:histidine phosphatase family protein [Algoriphagus sp.]
MKKLFLLRHGEAGFGEDTDFKRRLTTRGKSTVLKVAKSVRKDQESIDFMFCSSASRTQETAEIFGNEVLIKAKKLDEKIYSGDLNYLILLLESLPDTLSSCLIVGHNPTISLLLSLLSDSAYINLQPGNVGIIEFELDSWKFISRGSGILKEIIC